MFNAILGIAAFWVGYKCMETVLLVNSNLKRKRDDK